MENPSHVSLKRLVKCGISLGVYAASGVRALLTRLTGKAPRGSCVVVYYHSILISQRAQFANQLDHLLRYANPIALSERTMLDPSVHYAAVTFDDGLETFYDYALPELVKRRIPATMFVIADEIGKAFGPAGSLEKVMSLKQIRTLPDDLVTIGSHTLTHPFLPSINIEEATREIVQSRAKLEEILNRKILFFSFPFGGFNQKLVEICRKAGYQRIFSTLPQFALSVPDEFVSGRVRVDPTDWKLEFRLKLAGAYRWLPWAFALKRKVITNTFAQRMFPGKGHP
jgi:peptidoglycan/xylan/chitin deacetylase (PgdA/CDA1 family)